jgi:C-terminal peptidase prc
MKSAAARYIPVLLLGIVVGAGITLDMTVLAERERASAVTPLPLDELRTFTEVYARIKSDYVETIDDKKLLEYSIQGMLSGLDPHSSYLDADSFKDVRVETEGQFGGLGIEVTMETGFVKVVSPIEDTPAATAGLKPGDLIIRLDDKAVKGMALTDAVRLMRGKPGSDITLTVVREGQNKPLKFTITRAVIKIQSVKQRLLEPGYGYARITQFQAGTAKGLAAAIKKLEADNKNVRLKGLVLDLRNNPGGVLNGAVAVSDAFLEKGLIVYTEGRVSDSQLKFSATPGDILNGAPMVVLVNRAPRPPPKSSPVHCRTISGPSSWAPRHSARARFKPSCRSVMARRLNLRPRATLRPTAVRFRPPALRPTLLPKKRRLRATRPRSAYAKPIWRVIWRTRPTARPNRWKCRSRRSRLQRHRSPRTRTTNYRRR